MNPLRVTPALLSAACIAFAACGGPGGNSGLVEEAPRPASDTPPALAALATPYRAHGNEPFWGLVIEADSMTLLTPEADPLTAALPAAEPIEDGRRFGAEAGGQPFVATIIDRPCADGMSGMPYPHTVGIVARGTEYHGCGGDPAALLTGEAWVVEAVDGDGILDGSQPTLNFDADGRVVGNASCNSYTAAYRMTGEGLSFSEAVTTRMACAPPLMEQERQFLEALGAADRFEMDASGALILRGGERHSIHARRP